MLRKIRVLLLSIGIFVLGSIPVQMNAQVVEGATLGAFLATALDQAKELVRQADETGKEIEIHAALNAENVITAAQVQYAKSLDQTMTALGNQENQMVQDVNTMLTELEKHTADDAEKVIGQAQLVANALPLSKVFPQLGSYAPVYAVPSRPYRLTLNGNFPSLADPAMPVSLSWNGRIYTSPSLKSTTQIAFLIPVEQIGILVIPNSIARVNANVSIGWPDCFVIGWPCTTKLATYSIDVPILPSTPPTVTFFHDVTSTNRETSTSYSETWYNDSSQDDDELERCIQLSQEQQNQGWAIVPNTTAFELRRHVEGTENSDWFNKGPQGHSDVQSCWKVKTLHKRIGSSGKIYWGLRCQIARTVTLKNTVQDTIPLSWASTHLIDVQPGSNWHFSYHNFSGGQTDVNKTDIESSILSFSVTNNAISVRTFGQDL